MRSFRSDRENFNDKRIPYIFLAIVAAVCLITVLLLGKYKAVSETNSAMLRRGILTECADALLNWESAQTADERLTASLRFENAINRLPPEVSVEALIQLSQAMLGGTADIHEVRSMADTFLKLSAAEFENENEAWNRVADVLSAHEGAAGNLTEEVAALPPSEVLLFTESIVKKTVHRLFDGNEGTMTPRLSPSGKHWNVTADNVMMSFDSVTGSLDRFVFLRLGAVPGETVSQSDIVEIAKDFYCTNRRRAIDCEASVGEEINGFTSVDIADDGGIWRVCVDSHGRVWSLIKVKR